MKTQTLKRANVLQIMGSSLKGYINISFKELKKVLGEPKKYLSEKTQAAWYFIDENNTVFSIYTDQKRSTTKEWHIGGKNVDCLSIVQKLFPDHLVKFK